MENKLHKINDNSKLLRSTEFSSFMIENAESFHKLFS